MVGKKTIIAAVLLALPIGFVSAAEKKASTNKAGSQAKTISYKVDTTQSKVLWLGKKVTGQHNGSVAIKNGDLHVANGEVVGGNAVIDLASITVEDLQGDSKGKLEGHLKSDDFFGVDKNPTSNFEITTVQKLANPTAEATHNVTGNLTIKGKTNTVTFPAKITVAPDRVNAEAKNVEIDRTLYDIRYGSGKFFQGLGDKVIYDNFWLDIVLVATK